jgi:hypothetical protein
MLQVSTGKFFKHEAHETLRRAILYTNYRIFHDVELPTLVGRLLPAFGAHGLGALTCEIIERMQKIPGGPYPGEMVATSGTTLINDFAAIVSFALDITCTPDIDLAGRLTSSELPSLGADLVPQKFIPRMFDRSVNWQPADPNRLERFVADLMALERKSYEAAMRAIRRYVIGSHRISDDVNLAYALFVMSMESLAQKFDGFDPAWGDYDQAKRRRIDEALGSADEATADRVRTAILDNEHVALARRFREFTLAHLTPGFFRGEAESAVGAVSRPDLSIALRQAYSIRSGFVHHLEDIPRLLVGIEGFHETMEVDGQPTLTFAGLSRVARHVIHTFIARGPKVETEEFDWMKDVPGKLTMRTAPEYWIANPQGYEVATARLYLEGFMGQVIARLKQPSAIVTNIQPVLAKIETLVPSLAKPAQRLPMLVLYFIFNCFVSEDRRSIKFPALIDAHKADFETPSVPGLAAHFVTGQDPDWSLPEMEALHAKYFSERHHVDTISLGRLLEATFSLYVAEQNRQAGNADRARELIAFAVEACPRHQPLRDFELALTPEVLPLSTRASMERSTP